MIDAIANAVDVFCILCGASHSFAAACDPGRMLWVRKRRMEIKAGVPWDQATRLPDTVDEVDRRQT